MTNFAITGVGGFVAPRHLEAIKANRGLVVAAFDPHDSVGILDRYNLDCEYFQQYERFERWMEDQQGLVHYLSVCSPNFVHDAHVRLGLRTGCSVICEKPLVVTPHNLDALRRAEDKYGRKVSTILQLRHHPTLIGLKEELDKSAVSFHNVVLTYVTARGPWYDYSWKGDESKSGGVSMNIGVHLFDLMGWFFGRVEEVTLHLREPRRMAGAIRFERAIVRWFLSIDDADISASKQVERRIVIDGDEVEFSEGFTDLHAKAYAAIIGGKGFGIEDARPSIELIHRLRMEPITTSDVARHPKLL